MGNKGMEARGKSKVEFSHFFILLFLFFSPPPFFFLLWRINLAPFSSVGFFFFFFAKINPGPFSCGRHLRERIYLVSFSLVGICFSEGGKIYIRFLAYIWKSMEYWDNSCPFFSY